MRFNRAALGLAIASNEVASTSPLELAGMVPRAFALRGSKYKKPSVFCRAEVEAFWGSMRDSVILVRVRSLFAGRKFFTPEMRESKLAPRPAAWKRSVRREEMEVKPRKRSVVPPDWAGCCWVGAEESMVMRVSSRTL